MLLFEESVTPSCNSMSLSAYVDRSLIVWEGFIESPLTLHLSFGNKIWPIDAAAHINQLDISLVIIPPIAYGEVQIILGKYPWKNSFQPQIKK